MIINPAYDFRVHGTGTANEAGAQTSIHSSGVEKRLSTDFICSSNI
jgi:hypothetical protein